MNDEHQNEWWTTEWMMNNRMNDEQNELIPKKKIFLKFNLLKKKFIIVTI